MNPAGSNPTSPGREPSRAGGRRSNGRAIERSSETMRRLVANYENEN